MIRPFAMLAVMLMVFGLVDRIDTAMTNSGTAIALALTAAAPAVPMMVLSADW